MKINLKLFDLLVDKIKNPIGHYIDLQEDRIIYYLETYVDKDPSALTDEPEEDMNVEEDIYYLEINMYKRDALVGTSLAFSEDGVDGADLFIVLISCIDAEKLKFSFDNRKEAVKFQKTIMDYILNKDENKSTHHNK